MKKLTCWLAVLVLVLSMGLTACGKETTPSSESVETTTESTTEETTTEETTTEETTSSETEESTTEETTTEETEPLDEETKAKLQSIQDNYNGKVFVTTAESLNVREGASTSDAVVGILLKGSGGEVLDEDTEGWLHIKSGTLIGYISSEFAKTGEEAEKDALDLLKERVRVNVDTANIRSTADLEGEVLGSTYFGAIYDYLSEENGFFKIHFAETDEAWIHEACCDKDYFLNCALRVERREGGNESSSESQGETDPAESTSAESTDASETEPQTTAPQEAVTPAPATNGMPARITQGSNGLTVCIDAGHQQAGMSDTEPIGPGASVMKAKLTTGTAGCVTGAAEYAVNLTVSLKLEQELLNRGYSVVMIRTTNDCPYSNAERAVAANNSGANCFIRIHCNSLNDSSVKGIINYAPANANPYMSADLIANSQRFATVLGQFMSAATGAQNRGIIATDEMTGINWCKVPVSLVEMGFMSNPDEDRLLSDDNYQNLLVRGMADGIDAFFGR